MFDVICGDFHLLQMMSRFGISLGVGEKSVREVCDQHEVHVPTFLAVANYLKLGHEAATTAVIDTISVPALMAYLRQAHTYFLNFQLPNIRRKLIGSIDCSTANEVSYLVLKFYDEYMGDVRKHMEYENRKVFAYVDRLLQGESTKGFEIKQFAKSHIGVDKKLQELKNLIIKYYKGSDSVEMLNTVLFDIFTCEEDLRQHCHVEDDLFVPAVQRLEVTADFNHEGAQPAEEAPSADVLSEREREIVGHIVRGLSNKEVADKLFISVNTVLTHRKNIFRKLDIHSVSGLTIYAIVNGIVKLEEVSLDGK